MHDTLSMYYNVTFDKVWFSFAFPVIFWVSHLPKLRGIFFCVVLVFALSLSLLVIPDGLESWSLESVWVSLTGCLNFLPADKSSFSAFFAFWANIWLCSSMEACLILHACLQRLVFFIWASDLVLLVWGNLSGTRLVFFHFLLRPGFPLFTLLTSPLNLLTHSAPARWRISLVLWNSWTGNSSFLSRVLIHFWHADDADVLNKAIVIRWHWQNITTWELLHKGSNYQPEELDVWFVRIKNHSSKLCIDVRGPHDLILSDKEQVWAAGPGWPSPCQTASARPEAGTPHSSGWQAGRRPCSHYLQVYVLQKTILKVETYAFLLKL